MIALWSVLVACLAGGAGSQQDDSALVLRCERNDLAACYELRDSKREVRRENALATACSAGYRDSCRLLFEWKADSTDVLDMSAAFNAAADGCRKNKDVSLCKQVLAFADRGERFVPMVDKQRAAVEAVMREAGVPVPATRPPEQPAP